MRLTNSRRTHVEGQEWAKDTNLPLTLHQLWTGRGYLGNEAEFEKHPGGSTQMGEIQGAPKEESTVVKIKEVGNLYKHDEFINNYIIQTPHKPSSQPNQQPDNHSTMQSIELYNPISPNLHLTPFASSNSSSEDLNLLNYQLTTNDFIALKQPDSQLFYFLNPSTTTSLFWALNRLARHITRAASHDLHSDPTIPFTAKGYIPHIYFDRINMQRPDILAIQDHNFLNPLYGYTTRENLAAWYRDFQTLGRLAVQWIRTAQWQTLQLGPGTGWNWEAHHGARLEYPNHCLITSDSTELSQSIHQTKDFWTLTEYCATGH